MVVPVVGLALVRSRPLGVVVVGHCFRRGRRIDRPAWKDEDGAGDGKGIVGAKRFRSCVSGKDAR
jgi:hypothetical protein